MVSFELTLAEITRELARVGTWRSAGRSRRPLTIGSVIHNNARGSLLIAMPFKLYAIRHDGFGIVWYGYVCRGAQVVIVVVLVAVLAMGGFGHGWLWWRSLVYGFFWAMVGIMLAGAGAVGTADAEGQEKRRGMGAKARAERTRAENTGKYGTVGKISGIMYRRQEQDLAIPQCGIFLRTMPTLGRSWGS